MANPINPGGQSLLKNESVSDAPEIDRTIKEIREATVQALAISENIGQVILYLAPPNYRCIHESRNIDFVFIEIIMYPGRHSAIKRELMERITDIVQKHTGVERTDINCFISEISADNWFGGTSHHYIKGLP